MNYPSFPAKVGAEVDREINVSGVGEFLIMSMVLCDSTFFIAVRANAFK